MGCLMYEILCSLNFLWESEFDHNENRRTSKRVQSHRQNCEYIEHQSRGIIFPFRYQEQKYRMY